MNERKQWKADYKELTLKIRKHKQEFKDALRACNKVLHQHKIKQIRGDHSWQPEVLKAWTAIWDAKRELDNARYRANWMMTVSLPEIKERAKAVWEARNGK